MKKEQVRNKIAIVTGAGSGIGRHTTLALLKEGYTVVLAGRRIEMLEKTVSLWKAENQPMVVPTDVTAPDSVHSLFNQTMNTFGRLDLLFNNAGIGAPSHAAEAIEMGADAVLVNTAIAVAEDPVGMARAFRLTVEAARIAFDSGLPMQSESAEATSPLTGFLDD